MRFLAIATVLVGLSNQPTNDDTLRLSNIEIILKRVSSGASLRIEARIFNANVFPVFDVIAACDFKDRRGHVVSSNTVTIIDAIQARQIRRISQLFIEGWPDEAWSANCTSNEAKRLPE